jgi:16S rRNA (guanine527-N7)-methyltransferase
MLELPRDPALDLLAERYRLSDHAAGQLERLLTVLVSDRLAPTAIQAPRRAVDDHLADALVALELDVVRAARTVADLGSGTGVPGLPLAIAKASARVWLVESNRRRCAFLERAARACGVANVTVIRSRAESWSEGLGRCELVTARALDSLTVVAEYAAPLLRIGGALVAWRGRRDRAAEAAACAAMSVLGLEPEQVRRVRPFDGAEHRYLHVILKVRETPGRFPRREGMARKRPLDERLESRSSDSLQPSDRRRR